MSAPRVTTGVSCDEWIAGDRRYLSEGSMAELCETSDTDPAAAIDGSDS